MANTDRHRRARPNLVIAIASNAASAAENSSVHSQGRRLDGLSGNLGLAIPFPVVAYMKLNVVPVCGVPELTDTGLNPLQAVPSGRRPIVVLVQAKFEKVRPDPAGLTSAIEIVML